MRYLPACFTITFALLLASCRPVLSVHTVAAASHPLPDTAVCAFLGLEDSARITGTYIGYIAYEPGPAYISSQYDVDVLKKAAIRKGANLVKVTFYYPGKRKITAVIRAEIYKVADTKHYETSVEWTGNRELDFSDFKGPPWLGGDSVRSMGKYEFYLVADFTHVPNIKEYYTRVEFYGNSSWIDKGSPVSGALLLHEQGNFDLCEIYRLQLQKALPDLRNLYINPEDIYRQIHAAYMAKRAQYDSETAHGLNFTVQAEWTKRITTLSGFDVGPLLTRRQLKKKARLESSGHTHLPFPPNPLVGCRFPVPFRS
jgi:hypothetical protein